MTIKLDLSREQANIVLSTLASKLVVLIHKLRQDGTYTQQVMKDSGVSEAILFLTGINADFMVKKGVGQNAYVRYPNLDRNHPFLAAYGYTGGTSEVGTALLATNREVIGTIDRKNWKVGGIYSKIKMNITVGHELLASTIFSDEEVVGVILHELGHIFDYFDVLGGLVKRNFLLHDVSKQLAGQTTHEQKVKVLVEAERQLGIQIQNKDDIINAPDKVRSEVAEAVIITEDMIKNRDTSGNPLYDVRTLEQSADRFAIHHGAGVHLGTALNKLYQNANVRETRGAGMFLAVELLKVALFLIGAYVSPFYTILYLIGSIPGPKVYDSPNARIELIKRQLIGSIKDNRGDKEYSAILREQVAVLEDLQKGLNDRRSLYDTIYQTITPRGRSMYKQEVHMKNVENLLYNDFYLNSAKFGEHA